jgi:hypothetical protein
MNRKLAFNARRLVLLRDRCGAMTPLNGERESRQDQECSTLEREPSTLLDASTDMDISAEMDASTELVTATELNAWRRGFTPQAEIWNGRLAMLGLSVGLSVLLVARLASH